MNIDMLYKILGAIVWLAIVLGVFLFLSPLIGPLGAFIVIAALRVLAIAF